MLPAYYFVQVLKYYYATLGLSRFTDGIIP